MGNEIVRRHAVMEIIRKMPNKTPIYGDNRDVIDRAAAQAEIMLLPPADVYYNIIAVLESVKEMCEKTSCRDCPFSATYRRKGESTDIYYCKLASTPDGWQIDSVNDDAVFYKVERGWVRNG